MQQHSEAPLPKNFLMRWRGLCFFYKEKRLPALRHDCLWLVRVTADSSL